MSADLVSIDDASCANAHQLGPGDIAVEIILRGVLAAKLLAEARRRGRPPAELFADIVEAVLDGDLVTAVIDD